MSRVACRALRAALGPALLAAGLLGGEVARAETMPAPVDFSGRWLPDPARAQPWPAELPLTNTARVRYEQFVPDDDDPIVFCMPFGTPRNTLSTEFPMEVLQTPDRVTLVFQPNLSNVEVRRVALGGKLPEEIVPSWFGTSIGRWEGDTLVVETVGIDTDVLISRSGLPHSEELRVVERMRIAGGDGPGRQLVIETTLHDPLAYREPLRTVRVFTWAPNVQFHESRCPERLWIDTLWRDRLAERVRSRKSRESAE